MANPIDPLVTLQNIDSELKAARSQLDELSGTVDRLRHESESLRKEREEKGATVEGVERRRKELDFQLRAEEDRTKGHRMRMERVRNERELAALRHEVDRSKEMISLLEEEILVLYEQIEEGSKELAELDERLGTLDTELAARSAELDEKQAELEASLTATEAEREKVAESIDGDLIARYDAVARKCAGLAVVAVRGGVCSGCGLQVRPQLVTQIHRGTDLVTCPSCTRLLYVPI